MAKCCIRHTKKLSVVYLKFTFNWVPVFYLTTFVYGPATATTKCLHPSPLKGIAPMDGQESSKCYSAGVLNEKQGPNVSAPFVLCAT